MKPEATCMSGFVETKRTLDGRVQTFQTRLLVATQRMAAVRFDFAGSTYAHAGGFSIPSGSFTTGFFWRDRTYNLYHITDAGGSPIADRFDVVEGARIRSDGLEYTDLLLDLWVSPLGEAHFDPPSPMSTDELATVFQTLYREYRTYYPRLLLRSIGPLRWRLTDLGEVVDDNRFPRSRDAARHALPGALRVPVASPPAG